jgi:hypothetical protein
VVAKIEHEIGGVRGDLRVGDKPTQETRSLVSVEMELHARFHKI